MLTALQQSNKEKVIGDAINKDKSQIYICEYCESIVIHNKSEVKIKIGHFKHKRGQSCPNNSKETIAHLKTKLSIFNYIKDNWGSKLKTVELEKWICDKTIRPDIYIETKKNKIAIEVQASALTASEIRRRTDKYYKENIHVLWVLLYDFHRFHEYTPKHGMKEDNTFGVVSSELTYKQKVRLKEFELFIYSAYSQQLIMWDLTGEHSDAFMVIKLSDYVTEAVDFYKGGEYHSYDGKATKVLKSTNWIMEDVSFEMLRPSFQEKYWLIPRKYFIPDRRIFTFDIKTFNK